MTTPLSLNDVAHLIQTALAPAFLLSGIGSLLNVFASRLARVADQVAALTKPDGEDEGPNGKLLLLRRRALILDYAVVLATAGAAATCLSILALFLFALTNRELAYVLLVLFGLAVLCALGSVLAFGLEMVLSNHEIRQRISFHLPHLPHLRWRDRSR